VFSVSSSALFSWGEQDTFVIMGRTRYIWWDDNDVCFVLDQHSELDFNSASSLKQESAVNMSFHSDTLFFFRANKSLPLL
jgi:hypothetical protein